MARITRIKYNVYAAQCPTRQALDRIADKWTALIVGLLGLRTHRFGELRRGVEGISHKVLSHTLRSLERDGLVHRSVLPTNPPSVEKPGEGVRSVGDVFNLIVNENKMLVGVLAGAPAGPRGARLAPITDPAELQAALRASSADLKQALAALSENDLKTSVRMFGRDTTKQGAALMLLFDQHEHLGQSIAHARSNGVVPPWSQGAK